MIPRFALKALLAIFVVLLVTATVLLGSVALANAAGDGAGARVLQWLAMGTLICLLIDSLLLLGALGLLHVEAHATPLHSADKHSPRADKEGDERAEPR